MGFLMNFLINECDSKRIEIENLNGATSETSNNEFWDRLDILKRERSGNLFPIHANEATVAKICSAPDSLEFTDTENILFELYHMGYITLKPLSLDEKEYEFILANYIKEQLLHTRMEEHRNKKKNGGYKYVGKEVDKIKKTFELEYWRNMLEKVIKPRVENEFADAVVIKKLNKIIFNQRLPDSGIKKAKIQPTESPTQIQARKRREALEEKKGDRAFEDLFKHVLKDCLYDILKTELYGCLNNYNQSYCRVKNLFRIRKEEYFVKVVDNFSANNLARMDIAVFIELSENIGDRLIMIFELKKEEPKVNNLKIFTEPSKYYDKLKFREGEKVIYVAGSISEFKNKKKPESRYDIPRAQFFADTNFEPYRVTIENARREQERNQVNKR